MIRKQPSFLLAPTTTRRQERAYNFDVSPAMFINHQSYLIFTSYVDTDNATTATVRS
jgi:hypothetical protein